MFSKTCEYALQAMMYIAFHTKTEKPVGLKEVAGAQAIPLHFLSKVLQELVKHDILGSVKGPKGGFFLKKSPESITLLNIVMAIDGPTLFERCGLGLRKCTDKTPCPVHFEYQAVRTNIKSLLGSKTLSQLNKEVAAGQATLYIPENP